MGKKRDKSVQEAKSKKQSGLRQCAAVNRKKQKHKIKSDIRSICRGYCYIVRCKAFANIMRISLLNGQMRWAISARIWLRKSSKDMVLVSPVSRLRTDTVPFSASCCPIISI